MCLVLLESSVSYGRAKCPDTSRTIWQYNFHSNCHVGKCNWFSGMSISQIDCFPCYRRRRTAQNVGPSCSPQFYRGCFSLGKKWLPYLNHSRPCPALHRVENNESTPTDNVRAVWAAVQVIDVDSPDGATKGEAWPAVIDVDAPAATQNACTSGAIGASSPPRDIDFDGLATTVKGSLVVIDVDANTPDPAVVQQTSFIWCRYPSTEIQQRDETTK